MVLTARTSQGEKAITKLAYWKNRKCSQDITSENINEFLEIAKRTGKITWSPREEIDAFTETPLYTNGQLNVTELLEDGLLIWKKYKA